MLLSPLSLSVCGGCVMQNLVRPRHVLLAYALAHPEAGLSNADIKAIKDTLMGPAIYDAARFALTDHRQARSAESLPVTARAGSLDLPQLCKFFTDAFDSLSRKLADKDLRSVRAGGRLLLQPHHGFMKALVADERGAGRARRQAAIRQVGSRLARRVVLCGLAVCCGTEVGRHRGRGGQEDHRLQQQDG